jgi:MFS family permease
MSEENIQVYGTRWTVLLLFMFPNLVLQILWISFATVTTDAMAFYNVTDELMIYLLSMSFMIVYIPVAFLASWLIDKYDFKVGAGIGAVLTAIFGFLRIFTVGSFELVLIFQIFLAIGQPFLLNSVTKLSANWFPESERTTATGIALISSFLGNAIGLFLTPFLALISFQSINIVYGILALASGILFIVFAKNKPPTPPSSEIRTEKVFMVEGLRQLFKNKDFLILFAVFLVGLGVFNTVLTFIEGIVIPRGYDSTFAGILGGLMLIGGIVGSFVISVLSDKYQKRKILCIISLLIASVSLFVISLASIDAVLLLFGFIFGFGLISAAPVALEYAVDATSPVPEASSNGMLMMIGQVGGIIFILGLEDLQMPVTLDYFPALILLTILLAICFVLAFFLKETEK